MSGYDLLNGLIVLEMAQLGPDSLGGYLADMGATVIKIEPPEGDPVRFAGNPAMGSPEGESLLHLRWNRGKQSIIIDLRTEEGRAQVTEMAQKADVVIEGMRAGVLERLGLGYETLKAQNPKLVFCSISGMGSYGPYANMGSHGPSFDAFGALSAINPYALSPEERDQAPAPIGMHAMGLFAAVGTLSAVIKAIKTGEGCYLEVAAADCAALWLPDTLDATLNPGQDFHRPGFLGGQGKMANWPRLWRYACGDGRYMFFQAFGTKFWKRFCEAVERPDLWTVYEGRDVNDADDIVFAELSQLFLTRSFAEWMELFGQHDVPAAPANSRETLAQDPHFLARDNVYDTEVPGIGPLRLTGTPIKVAGQSFAPEPAPNAGQHSEAVQQLMQKI